MNLMLLFIFCISLQVSAKSIKDFSPYHYDVFFTNPVCESYSYEKPVLTNKGEYIHARPKNVYCTKNDLEKNIKREASPNFQIRKLISDPNVTEMFFSFLSFSDEAVANDLCKAIEERNIKVTFIIDSTNNKPRRQKRAMSQFNKISKCSYKKDLEKVHYPRMELRGNEGNLGFAHNKLILAHYKDSDKVTMVFGSANMSNGTLTHHENWNFLTTSKKTYFYQTHECLRVGMLDHGKSNVEFKKYIKECRSLIKNKKEDDIELFIIPSDGKVAMNNIISNMEIAKSVDVAAHRFTHSEMISSISKLAKEKKIRFLADDDIYWSGVLQKRVAANTKSESANVQKIEESGVEISYLQTNDKIWQLHHNKFAIFNFKDGSSYLHTGAGNFTYSAFSKNYENFYFIKIPEVVEKFKAQYERLFSILGTIKNDMPQEHIHPVTK